MHCYLLGHTCHCARTEAPSENAAKMGPREGISGSAEPRWGEDAARLRPRWSQDEAKMDVRSTGMGQKLRRQRQHAVFPKETSFLKEKTYHRWPRLVRLVVFLIKFRALYFVQKTTSRTSRGYDSMRKTMGKQRQNAIPGPPNLRLYSTSRANTPMQFFQ